MWASSHHDLSAAFHQPADRGHHLRGHLLGPTVAGALAHAVPGMPVEQAECHLVQSGLDGSDLGEDVDAVTVVLDHPLDATYLALDAAEPAVELLLGGGVAAFGCHAPSLPPYGVRVSRHGRGQVHRPGRRGPSAARDASCGVLR